MSLRDKALPLVKVEAPWPGTKVAPTVPLTPAQVPPYSRFVFTPAYRPAGWRQALLLQGQQRRLQRNKGVR